jgi:phospholipid/cholesterol/gamma-HCH transport system ATP-binding protein
MVAPTGASSPESLPPPPAVRVEDLRKRFRRQMVLRGVNLEVHAGELMVIIGRSGGGKSVLLRHLMALVRPDSGRVLIDDQDLTRLRGRALDAVRERFGVVFQGGALFDSLTVWDNVRFPLREKSRLPAEAIETRVQAALDQVGLGDMGDKFPAEVSGGMRKRVAIARALVTEPRIVFLDEPTTGLDPILVNTIHHLVVELQRKFNFTAVMVSHELPEIFRIAHRVAVLHEGRIRSVGTPAEIEGSDDPLVRQFIRGEIETHAT